MEAGNDDRNCCALSRVGLRLEIWFLVCSSGSSGVEFLEESSLEDDDDECSQDARKGARSNRGKYSL